MRGERDDGAQGIYLLAALPRSPQSPSFSFSLSIFIKMPGERKKEKERGREKERKRPARAKYENPYSREEKISVI